VLTQKIGHVNRFHCNRRKKTTSSF
jgi:hypothetical protein